MEFQKKQLEEFREGLKAYQNASIYTILYDLVDHSDVEEIFVVLYGLAEDLGQIEQLKEKIEESKDWKKKKQK